jgi:hypothetical protein
MDDPNINPAWDILLGEDTNAGVIRLVGLILVFVVLGGSTFWLIG